MFHHSVWECRVLLKEMGEPAADWKLHDQKPEQWIFWHFGVVPVDWVSLQPLTEEVECSGIFAESWRIELAPGVVLATDGSGGPFSSNPRKRQCVCSVVAVMKLDGEFVELGHVVATSWLWKLPPLGKN